MQRILPYGILLLTLLFFYGNTIQNGFVHDDIYIIPKNPLIKEFRLEKLFTSCSVEVILGQCKNKASTWRPLHPISNALVYVFSSSPSAYHIVNLLYMFVLSLLVFHFFKHFLGHNIALIGALIFLTHPINSEVVNWIAAVPELLLGIFFLSSFMSFKEYEKKKKIGFLLLSLFLYALSLLAKETALFLLPILPLYIFLLTYGKFNIQKLKHSVFALCFYTAWVAMYFFLRIQILGRPIYVDKGYHELFGIVGLYNALWLYPKYIFKFFYPLPLSLQHSFDKITTFDSHVWIGLFFIGCTIFFVYFLLKKKMKVALFGFSLLLFALLPVLVFINKLGEFVFSERYLFIPSIGFILILLAFLRKLLDTHKSSIVKIALLTIFGAYLILSWYIVFHRNYDWKDQKASFLSIIRVNPKSASAHYNLGKIYFLEGNLWEGKKEFERAFLADSSYAPVRDALSGMSATYSSPLGFSFLYPKEWSITEKDFVKIEENNTMFTIELRKQTKEPLESVENYLNKFPAYSSVLINQGLADIPGYDVAYVRMWDKEGIAVMQFFLFKNTHVIEVRVWPFDSPFMRQFDTMMITIRID